MASVLPLILAVDDEANMLKTYRSLLAAKYEMETTSSAAAALELLEERPVSVILLDIKMPGMDGLSLLRKIKELKLCAEVIVITASRDAAPAVEAMKRGAFDYLTKPFEAEELVAVIEKALEKTALLRENLYLKDALRDATAYCDLIGQTDVMKKLFGTIDKVSQTDSTVLVHGESGTGKELVARAIHLKSRRSTKPFVTVNCAAIPENLMESELFGHERGSFTGALERRLGKFELADGGTIFLDEIGCMPMPMQSKLLRIIENKLIERLGGDKSFKVDVRIISATNIDFEKEIAAGRFRHDLYYRLNVIPVDLVPLRERKEDIPLFIRYFLEKFNKELNKKVSGFSPAALQALLDYQWPGNIRELQNLIERVVVLAQSEVIEPDELPIQSRRSTEPGRSGSLAQIMEEEEKKIIKKALADCNNNRSMAAKKLMIARSTLISKIEALGIS